MIRLTIEVLEDGKAVGGEPSRVENDGGRGTAEPVRAPDELDGGAAHFDDLIDEGDENASVSRPVDVGESNVLDAGGAAWFESIDA